MDRSRSQGSCRGRIERLRDGCRHGRRRWSLNRTIYILQELPGWQEIKDPRPKARIKQTARRFGNKRTRSYSQQTPKVRPARTKQVGQSFRVRQACAHHETEMDVGRKEKGRKDRATIGAATRSRWMLLLGFGMALLGFLALSEVSISRIGLPEGGRWERCVWSCMYTSHLYTPRCQTATITSFVRVALHLELHTVYLTY